MFLDEKISADRNGRLEFVHCDREVTLRVRKIAGVLSSPYVTN